MEYLFSRENERMLEALSFTDTLYAFDFDGTLAPIVTRPNDARMASTTAQLFGELCKLAPTAIISGRSLVDLKRRVPAGPKYLLGNHGLEGLPNATAIHELEEMCDRWKAILLPWLKSYGDPGIVLEDKRYSLALHYRNSRSKKLARANLMRVLDSIDENAKIIPGKLVCNLVPARGPHKGVALSRLIVHSGAKFCFYIGDDHTDEDVFCIHERRLMTVRVGLSRKSQARYYIRRQSEIDSLLRKLLLFKKRVKISS